MSKYEKMPLRFEVLAQYNAEVYRGIMHTESWQMKMMNLKREYDQWIKDEYQKDYAARTRTGG